MHLEQISRWFAGALTATAVISGCAFDHRKEIAYRTLFFDGGKFDSSAYESVLSTRFPRGSSVSALKAYILEIGGTCRAKSPTLEWCEIPIQGRTCEIQLIGIAVNVDSEAIQTVKVEVGTLGC